MSWRRSEARVRASAYSTAPRASVASTSGQVLRASADATEGGLVGLGLPDSCDHLVVRAHDSLQPLDLASRGSAPYARHHQMNICPLNGYQARKAQR